MYRVLSALLALFALAPLAHADLRTLTVLATNDLHGGVEPSWDALTKKNIGGMALLAETVDAIRRGVKQNSKGKDAVLLVDAGDQFQGTLLSNRDEGKLVFDLLDRIGYDAVIPGNHDYDFGPEGWLDDRVTPKTRDQDKRGVIKSLINAHRAKIHFISANTYQRSSLKDASGAKVDAQPEECKVDPASRPIDWSQAKRADFLEPYTIRDVPELGIKVAFIGLDNPGTPGSTTRENVEDLCFRPIAETYAELRAELAGKADVFVIVMHDGDVSSSSAASDALRAFAEATPPLVDAIVAGHTHRKNDLFLGDHVPFIQSGSNGRYFGRIDLVWDTDKKALVRDHTKKYAEVRLIENACDTKADFCSMKSGRVAFDGAPRLLNKRVRAAIAAERTKINGDLGMYPGVGAKHVLGTAKKDLKSDRVAESALGDALSDEVKAFALKKLPDALAKKYTQDGEVDLVAFLNAGGLRRPLRAGDVTYEDLFEVLPFNNHGVVIAPISSKRLVSILQTNAKTCGTFGTLVFSGLKVAYRRDCKRNRKVEQEQLDPEARLESVKLVKKAGDVLLYDAATGLTAPREILITTLDFIAQGGEKFSDFKSPEVAIEVDLGIMREGLVQELLAAPRTWVGELDNRYELLGK